MSSMILMQVVDKLIGKEVQHLHWRKIIFLLCGQSMYVTDASTIKICKSFKVSYIRFNCHCTQLIILFLIFISIPRPS